VSLISLVTFMYFLISSFIQFFLFLCNFMDNIITFIFIGFVSDILFYSIGILRPFDIYTSLKTPEPEEFQSL
jgi:hypothetical protein